MKSILLKKLRSQKGASLSYALLLFLVCAVLCSVILVAATAASGRMAKVAETDQRYYAVTSAAELLRDVFKEHPTVSVVKVEKSWTAETYENGVRTGSAAADVPDGETALAFYLVADKKAAEIDESDLTAEFEEDTTTATIQQDAAKNICFGTPSEGYLLRNRAINLVSTFHEDAGLAYDALAVTVSEDLEENGNITLTLYNKYMKQDVTSTAGNRHTLVLSFGADRNVSTDTKTENVSSKATGKKKYVVTTKTTKTTTTTLTWTLRGIQTKSENA